ncbi:MAG: DeoR family transcriptional regulator, partial [Actinobacteria bacterium]|nr:DeoR family transcriptional regulator [Actinomycetota bacterium]
GDLVTTIRRNAKELILLCDSSKFETYSLLNILPISEIDEIITDNNLNPEIAKKIKKINKKIILV